MLLLLIVIVYNIHTGSSKNWFTKAFSQLKAKHEFHANMHKEKDKEKEKEKEKYKSMRARSKSINSSKKDSALLGLDQNSTKKRAKVTNIKWEVCFLSDYP